jgi:hypothetical protein
MENITCQLDKTWLCRESGRYAAQNGSMKYRSWQMECPWRLQDVVGVHGRNFYQQKSSAILI